MTTFHKRLIDYESVDISLKVRHYIVTAEEQGKTVLLSYPNLYLYDKSRSSIKTSERYAATIVMFYAYLSELSRFNPLSASHYHVICTNQDIRRWQVMRLIRRQAQGACRPSSVTIFEDAKIVLNYFLWLTRKAIPHLINLTSTTWLPNYKSERLLNYIAAKAQERVHTDSIRVLDQENRQRRMDGLITHHEIAVFMNSFADPVYACMFMLSLGTAMRPMDVCRFPYVGRGVNSHIVPYTEMDKRHLGTTVDYVVHHSKGRKTRKIVIHVDDLRRLQTEYIDQYYVQRAAKYRARHGMACPPDLLFLTANGHPITPKMIAARSHSAKRRAMASYPGFRSQISFYAARHWWPTQFLIRFFGDKLINSDSRLFNLAAAQMLQNQMGHSHLSTTFKHYVDLARLILYLNLDNVEEVLACSSQSTLRLLDYLREQRLKTP
ncbi:site-specific integrase [Pseudomonas chlororaphis]|uniref:DNA breaking-rejoining enzyme n=1 Tax=Pseudomonas chlororaphis TaxID=587753 RepID=UPI000BE33866|nr:DNA breaking-rejoining enzyme [Pseudomonas chlororaphis]